MTPEAGANNLVSFASGVVGALVGAGIAFLSQHLNVLGQHRAACRAVLQEAQANFVTVAGLRQSTHSGRPITDVIWQSHLALVAGALDRSGLRNVSEAYFFGPQHEALRQLATAPASRPFTEDELTRLDAGVAQWREAVGALESAAYTRWWDRLPLRRKPKR